MPFLARNESLSLVVNEGNFKKLPRPSLIETYLTPSITIGASKTFAIRYPLL